MLLVLAGGCLNLAPPSVTRCGEDHHICREDAGAEDGRKDAFTGESGTDAVAPDADSPDSDGLDHAVDLDPAGPDADPDTTSGPSDVAPVPSSDGPTDLAPDTAVDRAPDTAIDTAVDRAPDTAIDTAPDRAPDTGPVATCPGDSSLLLCLRFEGALVDESAPAATVTGSNLGYQSGTDSQAIRLASSSLLRAAAGWGSFASAFTLEVWIRPDRLPSSGDRMGLFDAEGRFGLFLLPGGGVSCSSPGGEAIAAGVVSAGRWSAVACTASGSTLTLWIDGQAEDQAYFDGLSSGSPAALAIGGNLPSGDPFEGMIDNVRVWSVARNAQQIAAHQPASP